MRAVNNNLVRLEGTIESAVAARKALKVARDLMPEGEDRDEIERVLRETIEIEFRDNLTDITLVSYYAGERR